MSSNDPFVILDLEKDTATVAAVKKAYSKKLKVTRPDDDPEGFMILREAFTQAKNQAQWLEQNPPNTAIDSKDKTPHEEKPEIKYWHDKKLDYHFNSSPSGKLIEKTIRWIQEQSCKSPREFFDSLSSEPGYQNPDDRKIYENFLTKHIYYEAGGEDYHDFCDDEGVDLDAIQYERPEWLSNQTLISIHKHFDLASKPAEYEWDALQINCMKSMFEPVLLENGIINKLTKHHSVIDFRAKEIEEYNKDDHGSYYDKEKRQWIDKSPVGLAMRDIEELIKKPWAGADKQQWSSILEREELQSIDEFQELDRRIRYFVTDQTGHGQERRPKKLNWLSREVTLLLDDTFGWRHQSARNTWEYDHFAWLDKIVGEYRAKVQLNPTYKSWLDLDRNSFEFLGYQPLPLLLQPTVILCLYIMYRLFQIK